MMSKDEVKVTSWLPFDPGTAFEVFTTQVDRWWRRGPRYRFLSGALRFEAGAGGRFVEISPAGVVHEIGRIVLWEPGVRLRFGWRSPSFAPGERTEVDIHFEEHDRGTLVTVVHSGWASLPADHPARYGLPDGAFGGMLGLWWADLLVAARGTPGPASPIARPDAEAAAGG